MRNSGQTPFWKKKTTFPGFRSFHEHVISPRAAYHHCCPRLTSHSTDHDTIGMPNLNLSLDHTGLIVFKLEDARQAFERLGFTLTPRSMHAGALTPGGPVVPWGSGNHCAMFRNGYFELLGLVEPDKPSTARRMLDRYEGLHIVAMDCESADAMHPQLTAAGVPAPAPATLERDAAFGPANDQTRRARFRNINLDGEAYPEARFIVIEHGTRDVLWQPHLLDHPNGATGLAAMYFAAADLSATLERFQRLLGTPSAHGDAYCFELRRGRFWVMSEAAMREHCPVLADGPVHRVAAACIEVRSLPALQEYLQARQIDYVAAPYLDGAAPSIWVAPAQASCAALQFIQAR
ncbi:glyoxalase-like domain protein [Bordetella pertussis H918]|nr:glyoxalase-like domain protein [Bordetella pertussis CHLA-11]ETH00651.1 glyoxalase-like domain protein [Bordetella pertussis 2250905]ETH07386.1 glyoxalase-like domain protein [Bordetella pertussis 2371640]ETH12682.1 glyoxalase-like domain protein [Bordetella pertussis STO1-SEAT-0006]ETH14820.1 glyoxalase-like domain protein [Bordetella pertussis STO1-SEAT-0007]ETH19696.1 glyoxalase-like domain protein [Bordetella pertussis CHLA-13]ETH29069.1 glyoxalase-like domain protein [Bordetella pertu